MVKHIVWGSLASQTLYYCTLSYVQEKGGRKKEEPGKKGLVRFSGSLQECRQSQSDPFSNVNVHVITHECRKSQTDPLSHVNVDISEFGSVN